MILGVLLYGWLGWKSGGSVIWVLCCQGGGCVQREVACVMRTCTSLSFAGPAVQDGFWELWEASAWSSLGTDEEGRRNDAPQRTNEWDDHLNNAFICPPISSSIYYLMNGLIVCLFQVNNYMSFEKCNVIEMNVMVMNIRQFSCGVMWHTVRSMVELRSEVCQLTLPNMLCMEGLEWWTMCSYDWSP